MTANRKIALTDKQLIRMIDLTAIDYTQEFDRLLGETPNLGAAANLVFEDEGIPGSPAIFESNVYTCLLINFYGMNELGWECGVWDCLDSYRPNIAPNLHQDQAERAYSISGGNLDFTVNCLSYLNKTFGTVRPQVPEYVHRHGPLFDNILSQFREYCRYAGQRHPSDYEPLSKTQQKLWDELTASKVMFMMIKWVRSSGLTQY